MSLLSRFTTTVPTRRLLINKRFLAPLPVFHLKMSTLSPVERENEVIDNLVEVRQKVEELKGSNVVCIQMQEPTSIAHCFIYTLGSFSCSQ
jgi:hypothetical protein